MDVGVFMSVLIKKFVHVPGFSFGWVVMMFMCAVGSKYFCHSRQLLIRVPAQAVESGVAAVIGSSGFTGHRCCCWIICR